MAREEINDNLLDSINGGSIVISPDCTMCGHNCNNQYTINDFSSLVSYVSANKYSMDEPTMLQNMANLGIITSRM